MIANKRTPGDLAREALMLASWELEASAQAAKEAAQCILDEKALWENIQRMYARLNQANYFVGRFQTLAGGVATRHVVSNDADEP